MAERIKCIDAKNGASAVDYNLRHSLGTHVRDNGLLTGLKRYADSHSFEESLSQKER